MVKTICGVFGQVKEIDLVVDPHTGNFTGVVNVEFGSESEAKRAASAMMGFKVGECVLDVRKVSTLEGPIISNAEGEMFR